MNVGRISRLLRLQQLLSNGERYNADGLAESCKVSRRTVFRDIEALRAAGVPVDFNADIDCYCLSSSSDILPAALTKAESLSLLLLAFELGQNDRLPFFDGAGAAAAKLESAFPQTVQDQFRRLRDRVHIRPSQVEDVESKRNVYHHLVEAKLSGHVQRISYDTGSVQGLVTTDLRPYYLIFCRHSWHVVGRSSVHKGLKSFSLSRIVHIERLPERFSIPPRFNLDTYLRNAWLISPEKGPDHDIKIRFRPTVARIISNVRWHKTQRITREKDGSVVFSARVSGLTEVVRWVLEYGDQAEVIKPKLLRQKVLQRARNMVALYESTESRSRYACGRDKRKVAKKRGAIDVPSGVFTAARPVALAPK